MALAVGVVAAALLPAAVFFTRYSRDYDLLHAALAIVPTFVLAFVTIALARKARARARISLRPAVPTSVRVALILAVFAISLASAATVAVTIYGLLSYLGNR